MLRKNVTTSKSIFALASGRLPCAVAIEKISGRDAIDLARKLFKPQSGGELEKKRSMVMGTLFDPEGKKIDDCLALVFVGPHSHTGEDSIEFHCHGSEPVIRKLEEALLHLGAAPAQPGEFSYRAHLNGKITANQMENLGDIYLARDTADLDQIYSRKDGSLTERISNLRENLVKTQAILDTAVDFSEEYSDVIGQAKAPLIQTIHECSEIIQRYSRLKKGATTPRLVLAGKPNAGKSSLFNALLGRYRAIVHEEAGTTRDVIEEDIEVRGRRWKLVDTAGFRDSSESREKEGIELGERFLSAAAFWILVVDGSLGISPDEENLIEKYGNKPHVVVWNKMDLEQWSAPQGKWYGKSVHPLSAKTADGINELWARLEAELSKKESQAPLPTAVEASRLEKARELIEALLVQLERNELPEYLAEINREATRALELVVGEVGTEDVLDRVFGEFCIGK
ncbi:MAG: tRNA uridine-5-carboxymethylaminomethyl(34) synthesis GTPase MnmE [Proteobacteria bacterium]|nr:tRNA uridine-5-carboxymethylaminomethyl(34) synthesis GTPase MnmE [Pseudomonadota bacterium]